MANDIYNYSVMTNTGKGFITNEDSRAFWRRSFRGNVWVATDVRESRHWVARHHGVSKTKAEAQAISDAVTDTLQTTWDDDNVGGESSAEKITILGGRPVDEVLP